MSGSLGLWIAFNLGVLVMLALDLGVFHRKAHVVTIREALSWTVVWIVCALIFNGVIYQYWDQMMPGSAYSNRDAALSFLTGYLLEKALAIDNIFVIVMIFTYFSVPAILQHRVLFWGILGALLMRGVLIVAGAALIAKYHWILYVFGGFLIVTGLRMAFEKNEAADPEKNPVVRLFRRLMPVTQHFEGDRFFVMRNGVRMATPLFMALVLVEFTDLILAVDSIPAIFAVTQEPFLVYTSNVFAILGLRSLYFVLAGMVDKFHYLKVGLAAVLVFVGTKMLVMDTAYKIPTGVSLIVVLCLVASAVIASLIWPKKVAPVGTYLKEAIEHAREEHEPKA